MANHIPWIYVFVFTIQKRMRHGHFGSVPQYHHLPFPGRFCRNLQRWNCAAPLKLNGHLFPACFMRPPVTTIKSHQQKINEYQIITIWGAPIYSKAWFMNPGLTWFHILTTSINIPCKSRYDPILCIYIYTFRIPFKVVPPSYNLIYNPH